jgi:hypothetical protein
MQKKLTISIDETIYDGLYRVIGARQISRFIETLVRPHVITEDLDAGYRAMAADEAQEAEALAWAEATIGDLPLDDSQFDKAVWGEVAHVAR